MELRNKKIVLTGASAGIGKELCRQLLNEGATVLAVARRVEKIDIDHPNLIKRKCDISGKEGVDELFEMAVKEMGDIDVYVNNAGFSYYEVVKTADWDHIDRIFKTNVYSPIYALEKMVELKGARPFNFLVTASAMSWMSVPGYTIYSGTKAAVRGFADAMRFELEKGQYLQQVCPIATRTEFFEAGGSEDVKIPFPSQSAEHVARCMVEGLKTNKRYIFPSKIFVITNKLNQFFGVGSIYQWVEAQKAKKWAREHGV